MCSYTLAAAGIAAITSAGSTAMSVSARNNTAEARAEAAEESMKLQQQALEQQQDQIIDQKNQQISERRLQAMRERSQLRVSFGEANVLGNSPLRQLHTSLLQEGKDVGQMESNKQSSLAQSGLHQRQAEAQVRGRINQAKAKTTGPLSSSLQIGMSSAQSGLSGYQTGQQLLDNSN